MTNHSARLMLPKLMGRPNPPRYVCFRLAGVFRRRSRNRKDRDSMREHTTLHTCQLLRGGHLLDRQQNFSTGYSDTSRGSNRRRITFVTDIEGDRDYLKRYVGQSKVLCFQSCHPRVETNDSSDFFPYDHRIDFRLPRGSDCLVYGGDVWDQGGSDLYVIRQLLDLRTRYPDRVFFVLGNRDLNKMRLLQELDQDQYGALPLSYGVYWFRGRNRVGDPMLKEPLSQDPVERLQWILTNTMGSPRAFQYRKWELQQEERQRTPCLHPDESRVTDEDVVRSYQTSTYPWGEMGRYIAEGKLAIRLGDVLFLHGAIPLTPEILEKVAQEDAIESLWDDMSFAMPWIPNFEASSKAKLVSIREWLLELDRFVGERFKSWYDEAAQGLPEKFVWSQSTKGYGVQGLKANYSQLMQYGMASRPDRSQNPTIVCNRWCQDGMPRAFFPDTCGKMAVFGQLTESFFRRSGLELICAGHQPQGDMPNPIAVPLIDNNRIAWVLSCDTSYSGDVTYVDPSDVSEESTKCLGRGNSMSGRGSVAVSEVLIEQCPESGKVLDVYWHGTLADGTDYQSTSLDFQLRSAETESQRRLSVGYLANTTGWQVPNVDGMNESSPWWTRAEILVHDSNGTQKRKHLLVHAQGFRVFNWLCNVEG